MDYSSYLYFTIGMESYNRSILAKRKTGGLINVLHQWHRHPAQAADQERSKKNHSHKNQNRRKINAAHIDGYSLANGIEDRFCNIMNKTYNGVERVRVHPWQQSPGDDNPHKCKENDVKHLGYSHQEIANNIHKITQPFDLFFLTRFIRLTLSWTAIASAFPVACYGECERI